MKKNQKKIKKNVSSAVISVYSTFNNTLISAADESGNTIASSSSGAVGFKGARKSTPYAAQMASEELAKKLKAIGVVSVRVKMKGPGSGRESILRSLGGFNVREIEEVTSVAHNGVRLPKARRV